MTIELYDTLTHEDNGKFFYRLPSDIILEIFTRLTPADSLRCMQVCRVWYNLIPQYGYGAWSTVQIFGGRRCSILKKRVWLQFLGKHVKHVGLVGFQEKNLYTILELLVKHECLNIQKLTFIKCTTADQERFLLILRKLGTNITELKLEQHISNTSFDYVLQTCPKLKRFTFDAAAHAYTMHHLFSDDPIISSVVIAQRLQQHFNFSCHGMGHHQFENLTNLNMYCVVQFQFRIAPILERCPNLRSFRLCSSQHTMYRGNSRHSSMPDVLDTILEWCPKLVYLDIYTDYYRNSDDRIDINDSLRKYVFKPLYDSYQSNYTGKAIEAPTVTTGQPLLSSTAETDNAPRNLQYFSTYGMNKYNPMALESFFNQSAPNLKHLVLGYVDQVTGILTRINNTPSRLESGWSSIFYSFARSTAPCLHTLVIEGIPLQRSVIIALETMLSHCSSLKTLVIRSTSLVLINFSHFFEQHWSHIQYLELDRVNMILGRGDDDTIQLPSQQQFNIQEIRLSRASNITFNLLTPMVSSLCPNLKRIDAMLHPERSSESDMCQFASMLRHNASKLQCLKLSNVRFIPPGFFHEICHVSTLCRISARATSSAPIQVDAAGFVQMLNKCSSMSTVSMDKVVFITAPYDYSIISNGNNHNSVQENQQGHFSITDIMKQHKQLNDRYIEQPRPRILGGGFYLKRKEE